MACRAGLRCEGCTWSIYRQSTRVRVAQALIDYSLPWQAALQQPRNCNKAPTINTVVHSSKCAFGCHVRSWSSDEVAVNLCSRKLVRCLPWTVCYICAGICFNQPTRDEWLMLMMRWKLVIRLCTAAESSWNTLAGFYLAYDLRGASHTTCPRRAYRILLMVCSNTKTSTKAWTEVGGSSV